MVCYEAPKLRASKELMEAGRSLAVQSGANIRVKAVNGREK